MKFHTVDSRRRKSVKDLVKTSDKITERAYSYTPCANDLGGSVIDPTN